MQHTEFGKYVLKREAIKVDVTDATYTYKKFTYSRLRLQKRDTYLKRDVIIK